jgi:ribosomal protein S18 acetylase RimI-like enzyme
MSSGPAAIAETDAEIERCYDVMAELRPHVGRSEFLGLVRRMESEGYRLAYREHEGDVVAVAGYRVVANLHLGRHLYVEDLVTSSQARSQGHGAALLEWLRARAREAGCRYLDLDSGTQRDQAHKFYFRHGLTIVSYHFSQALQDD